MITDNINPCVKDFPKSQPSTITIRGFANNEIRLIYRSAVPSGKVFDFLPNETKLIKSVSASRHKQYIDNLPDTRNAEISMLRSFSLWLNQIENSPGWHSCPFEVSEKIISKIFESNRTYSGGSFHRFKYLVSDSQSVLVWAIDSADQSGKFCYHFHIPKAQKLIRQALDIIDELQPSKKSLGSIGSNHPQRRFTKRARHTLLEAGEVVQQSCPSEIDGAHARAITLTLPGSSKESIKNLAAYSSWLLNCLLQEIRKSGEKIYYFGVWELQKRGALHLHLCIAINPLEQSMEFLKDLGDLLIKRWFNLLKSMASTKKIKRGEKSGNLPGIDMFERSQSAINSKNSHIKSWRDYPEKWQSDNQSINKNVAAYFSKYASKNVNVSNDNVIIKSYCPSRWWFCSKSVREKIKAFRFEYSIPFHPESIDLIKDIFRVFPPLLKYQYPFEIIKDSRLICEGHTEVVYWASSMFKNAHQIFQELKTTFAEIGYFRSVQNDRISTVLHSKKPVLFKLRKVFDDSLTDISIYEIDHKYSVCWRKYNHSIRAWDNRQLLAEFDYYDQSLNFVKGLISN